MKTALAVMGWMIVAAVAFVGLTAVFIKSPKCGEIGYYPKLSAVCRAALDNDRYCSTDERKDIACAAATYTHQREIRREEEHDALYTRRS